ncbi:MAG: hypothetical protein F4226_06925, partial [Synechococcus sp. SB0678_bin_12]|nr:hypothetical protein [Synechococcus sp. SB0678_bin_12]
MRGAALLCGALLALLATAAEAQLGREVYFHNRYFNSDGTQKPVKISESARVDKLIDLYVSLHPSDETENFNYVLKLQPLPVTDTTDYEAGRACHELPSQADLRANRPCLVFFGDSITADGVVEEAKTWKNVTADRVPVRISPYQQEIPKKWNKIRAFKLWVEVTSNGENYKVRDGRGEVILHVFDTHPHGVDLSKESLSVNAAQTESYTIALSTRPNGNVVVTPTSADGTIVTTSGPLTFRRSNWYTAQTVTVTATGTGSTTVNHPITTSDGDGGKYPTTLSTDAVTVNASKSAVSIAPKTANTPVTEGSDAVFT